ncbi:MAG: hypothetical protein GYA80_05430 [Chloroflexi bacterium]|nr:hypothetical protein [Chloroflexota bacterium]
MDLYTPKPEHKFPFGLWTVGSRDSDPFGSSVRQVEPPPELVYLLAAVGSGEYRDVQAACYAVIRLTGSIQPDDENTRAYAGLYPIFKELYPAQRSSFHQLGGL